VHCAFTDSFLRTYQELGYDTKGIGDQYIREWAQSAKPLGLNSAPLSMSELDAEISRFVKDEVAAIKMTPPIVQFILKPPFGKGGLLFYAILCNAAIATLDEPFLTVLGLKPRSKRWLKLSRVLLDFLSYLLGHESPSQKIARERIKRIELSA
jgi:hypothetical protein